MLQTNTWKKGRIFFFFRLAKNDSIVVQSSTAAETEKELRRFKACDLKGLGLLFSFQGQKDKKDVEKSFSDMYQTMERIQTVTEPQVKLIVKKHNNFAAVLNSKKK